MKDKVQRNVISFLSVQILVAQLGGVHFATTWLHVRVMLPIKKANPFFFPFSFKPKKKEEEESNTFSPSNPQRKKI